MLPGIAWFHGLYIAYECGNFSVLIAHALLRCTTETIANCSCVYFVVPANAGTQGSWASSLAPGPQLSRGRRDRSCAAIPGSLTKSAAPATHPLPSLPRLREREGGSGEADRHHDLRVHPTPERPISPCVINTVSQR